MAELFLDALGDSVRMIPWLLVIYGAIEFIEYRWGSSVRSRLRRAGKAGPALGALFGAVPQCGFSVVSSSLYTQRLITLGTLLAVYLSTSDEAAPVILSHPDQAGLVLPLLATKVAVGLVAGYAVDLVQGSGTRGTAKAESSAASEGPGAPSEPGTESRCQEGCCHHTVAPGRPRLGELVLHPLEHTAKIVLFVFLVTLGINYAVFRFGEENLGRLFLARSPWQPLLAGLVGLIPNCAASVAIAEGYLKGALSFGSTVAGLSSSAGLGVLVLLRENADLRDTARVLGLLWGISVAVGLIIHAAVGQ